MTHDDTSGATLDGLATTLAWFYPDVWPRLRLAHVADRTGHCRACRSETTGSPIWPCRLRVLADEAALVASAAPATAASAATTDYSRSKPRTRSQSVTAASNAASSTRAMLA